MQMHTRKMHVILMVHSGWNTLNRGRSPLTAQGIREAPSLVIPSLCSSSCQQREGMCLLVQDEPQPLSQEVPWGNTTKSSIVMQETHLSIAFGTKAVSGTFSVCCWHPLWPRGRRFLPISPCCSEVLEHQEGSNAQPWAMEGSIHEDSGPYDGSGQKQLPGWQDEELKKSKNFGRKMVM